ncbi:MAG: ABC transporter ATP-binding protein/permease [Acidobacteriia bacterium]|nr:ABC transporter ATP-binding protein/permease [Terriglobia bacterium]
MQNDTRKLFHYVRNYLAIFLLAVVLMAAVGAFEALVPLTLKIVFDKILTPTPVASVLPLPLLHKTVDLIYLIPLRNYSLWLGVALFIVGTALGKALCDYSGNYLISFVGQSVVMNLRNDLYKKILNQPASFFHGNSTGRLISRVTNDIEKIQNAASTVMADALRQIFTLVGMVCVLVSMNWLLALVAVLLAPLVALPSVKFGRKIRRTTRSSQDNMADISNILHETITGIRIVKAFVMERFEFLKFKEASRKLLHLNLKWVRVQSLSSPLMEVLGAVVIGGLLYYAQTEIHSGRMTPGTFIAFMFALFKMYDPVRRMSGINNAFQQAMGSTSRVFEFLELPEEKADDAKARPLVEFRDQIIFDRVSFSYDHEGPILKEVSLTVKKGEVVAVVGSSGSGKTTLLNLIPRFFEVTGGHIMVDGSDIREFTRESLRAHVGIVTQETILFNDSVRSNIAYGRPQTSQEDIEQAAHTALAHDFIQQMPKGYDTVIGERGQRLSGGERQRIAIARAILKNPPILILDEATSALDSESELYVQRALGNLMKGRTVFVIAHRLSTVRSADKIVVLQDGQVQEVGTHQDLLDHGGVYQRLYEIQFAETDFAPWVEAS